MLLVRYYFSFFPFCLLTYSLYTFNLVSAASYREGANVLNNTDGFLLKIFFLMVFPISFWLSLFHSKMFSDIKCSQLKTYFWCLVLFLKMLWKSFVYLVWHKIWKFSFITERVCLYIHNQIPFRNQKAPKKTNTHYKRGEGLYSQIPFQN